MGRKNHLSSASTARRDPRAGTANLSRRFNDFRGGHPRGTRIPESLRKAVVLAIQNGASRSSLQKTCGVSWIQMERWQARYGDELKQGRRSAAPTELPHADKPLPTYPKLVPPPRILPVVDDEPAGHAASAHKAPTLELQILGWRISLQPTSD